MRNLNDMMLNIYRRWVQYPMLRVVLLLIVGIILGRELALPLWGVATGFVVVALGAYIIKSSSISALYCGVMVLLAGVLSISLHHRDEPPGEYSTMEISVERITSRRANRLSAEGRVVAYICGQSGESRGVRYDVRIVADTACHLQSGERIVAVTKISPFPGQRAGAVGSAEVSHHTEAERGENRYGKYMQRRGFVGQIYLRSEDIVSRSLRPSLSDRLHLLAVERIERLNLSPDVEAVALAITTGARERITPALRADYSRAGAAHLLAVSGLHIGFVCAIANLLLLFLVLLHRGYLLRSLGAVALVWLYAAMVGFSPSVVRAATMFSLLQMLLTVAGSHRSFNALTITAFIMLLCNARSLYDVGFQLSFVAVVAILEVAMPLRRRVLDWLYRNYRSRRLSTPRPYRTKEPLWIVAGRRVGDYLLSALIVSGVATIATMPLTLYMFGYASLWGLLLSPPLLMLCAVGMTIALLWIVLPLPPLAPFVGWCIEQVVGLMNTLCSISADQKSMIFEGHISSTLCIALYLVLALVIVLFWAFGGEEKSCNRWRLQDFPKL